MAHSFFVSNNLTESTFSNNYADAQQMAKESLRDKQTESTYPSRGWWQEDSPSRIAEFTALMCLGHESRNKKENEMWASCFQVW